MRSEEFFYRRPRNKTRRDLYKQKLAWWSVVEGNENPCIIRRSNVRAPTVEYERFFGVSSSSSITNQVFNGELFH